MAIHVQDDLAENTDEFGNNLIGLSLHDNDLSGSIPRHFALPRSVKTLTLANNKLTGRIPRKMLELQREINTSLTILAANNRLSCDLPGSWNFTSNPQSLVLIGNAFSRPVPSWVTKTESTSLFLSIAVRARKGGGMSGLPLWLNLVILVCVMALFATPLLVFYHQNLAASDRRVKGQEYISYGHMSTAILECGRAVAVLAAASLLLFLLFLAGAKYYECGDGFIKYATAAYFVTDSPIIGWLFACLCTIWAVVLCFVLRRFSPPLDKNLQVAARAPNSSSRSIRRLPTECIFGCALSFLCLLAWFVTVTLVGGIPTLLYVFTYSMPADNSLHVNDLAKEFMRGGLALFLAFFSAELIPLITKPAAFAILRHGWNRNDHPAKFHEVEITMGIIARTAVIVVLPIASVILLDNSKA